MTPDLQQTLALFVGGLIGSACRAYLTKSQETFSRQSLGDVVIGAIVGVLYPQFPILGPLAGNVVQQASMVAIMGYFGASAIQNAILSRITKSEPTKP